MTGQCYDPLICDLANYTENATIDSSVAFENARLSLLDSLGCAILALDYPDCTKHLGPIISGTTVPFGSRVPGTHYVLDPIRAAFNMGLLIRWLDYNDTWLAAEWGHPSDNLGALLAITDHLSRKNEPIIVRDLLVSMIKAYEIQGILSLDNSLNRVGFDHVLFVKVASAAVSTHLLKGNLKQIAASISQSFVDTGPLRTYRHAPNTGPRKSWAAADATARGLDLAMITMKGEMGYPSVLSTPTYGFNTVVMKNKPLEINVELKSYCMENILYKVSFPAEFHAQTAVEAAIKLHPKIKDRIDDIEKIEILTQESAIRIIDKKGPLNNPADRDHCLQYMVAVGLIYGKLEASFYEEKIAKNPLIDILRNKMVVKEDIKFSKDYLDPEKRSISNSIKIYFKNGSSLDPITIEYPLGHKKRRKESLPFIYEKFVNNSTARLGLKKVEKILSYFENPDKLDSLPVEKFMKLFI